MKKRLIVTLIAIVVLLGSIGAFVAYVDPYQQYSRHDTYLGNQRLEIAGIARNHDYDAFITGSSMAMNHYPEQADSLWGWKTKNFSIMGATDDDYAVMLPYIIKQGKAKNVIWGIDFFSFARQRGAVNKYLYDDNLWNDYEYLWNYTSLNNAIKYLSNPLLEKNLYHFNSPFGRDILQKSYREAFPKGYPEENFDYEVMKERFDQSVLPIVQSSNDSVQWKIYFPPYSVAEFIIYDKFGDLDANLRLKRHIISTLSTLDNVELYDFQTEAWIGDLDEYMDLRHHSHGYNKQIIQSIHDGDFRAAMDGNSVEIHRLIEQYKDSI